MKLLITGAHFTPAQAVIEELKSYPELEIIYIGRSKTMEGDNTPSVESRVLPNLGVKFLTINAGRLSRNLSFNSIISIIKIPFGFIQGFWLVLKEQPDLTLSFGGYLSVPVVFSSWLLSVPIITHEQTLVMGLANRINSIFASKIAVSFPQNLKINPQKTILTGNPVRSGLLDDTTDKSSQLEKFFSQNKNRPAIFITGGNQGSHKINEQILKILPELCKIASVIHQTGDSKFNDYDKLVELRKNPKLINHYLIKKWFEVSEVSQIYKNVDLVIGRGGINTLYELAIFGLPSLIIPLPHLYKDEQTVNARYFAQIGLSEVINQNELTAEKLFKKIKHMVSQRKTYKENAKNAGDLIAPDGAKRLAQEVMILLENPHA